MPDSTLIAHLTVAGHHRIRTLNNLFAFSGSVVTNNRSVYHDVSRPFLPGPCGPLGTGTKQYASVVFWITSLEMYERARDNRERISRVDFR
jgi:hypothetical protein